MFINLTKKNKKTIDLIYIIYSFVVVLYQILHIIVPFSGIANAYFPWFSQGLAIIGLLLFLFDLITERVFLKSKYNFLLIALIAVMIISSIVNIRIGGMSGIINNAKSIIWQIAQILVIFPVYKRLSIKDLSKYIKSLYAIVATVWTGAAMVSIYQFLRLISYSAEGTDGALRQGFSEGRLFGVFSSPHFSAIFSLILIACSIYIIKDSKKTWQRVLCIFSDIQCFIFMVLTGTRTALITAIVSLAVVLFFYFDARYKARNNSKKMRYLKSIGISLVFCLAAFGVYEATYEVAVSIPEVISSELNLTVNDITEVQMTRTDTGNDDISNNRVQIWGEYIEFTTRNPLNMLFGNSPGNYMQVVSKTNPNLYIVSHIKEYNPDMFEHGLIYDTHSAYIGAYAMTGLLGLALILIFIICLFKESYEYIKGEHNKKVYISCFVLITILFSAAFDSDLFFRCNDTSVIFWFLAGVIIKMISNEKEEKRS